MTELISIRECARRLGVSDTAVRKAIQAQRITVASRTESSNRPLLAWPDAAEDWAGNSDPMKRTHHGGDGTSPKRTYDAPVVILETRADVLAPVEIVAAEAEPEFIDEDFAEPDLEPLVAEFVIPISKPKPETQEPRLPDENTEIAPMATIAQSRQISEAYSAKLKKLEYEEKSGRLIDIEKVKAQAFKSARSIRDSLMNIPDRCAAELAAEMDTPRVHARLSREIREILETLAGALE
jgi:hypothetical protein